MVTNEIWLSWLAPISIWFVFLTFSLKGCHTCHSAPLRTLHVFQMNFPHHANVDERNDGEDKACCRANDELSAERILLLTIETLRWYIWFAACTAIRFPIMKAGRWSIHVVCAFLKALSDGEIKQSGGACEEEDECCEWSSKFAGLVILLPHQL